MSESFLGQYRREQQAATELGPCVTVLVETTGMIQFAKVDGNRWSAPKGELEAAEFNPSSGITLRFRGGKVIVKGTSLERLYEAVLRLEVSEIRQLNERKDQVEAGIPSVTELVFPK